MMKIVINKCHGGFGLSEEALVRYAEIKGITLYPEKDKYDHITYWTVPVEQRMDTTVNNAEIWHKMSLEQRAEYNRKWSEQTLYDHDILRNDPALIQLVEELGERANGDYANLKVVEIPADVDWEIDEYDGKEWVAEKHRTWS